MSCRVPRRKPWPLVWLILSAEAMSRCICFRYGYQCPHFPLTIPSDSKSRTWICQQVRPYAVRSAPPVPRTWPRCRRTCPKAPRGVGMCIVRPERGPSSMIPPTGRARRNTRRWRPYRPTAARPTGRPRAARPCPRSSSTTPARWTAGATRRRGRTPRSGSTSS